MADRRGGRGKAAAFARLGVACLLATTLAACSPAVRPMGPVVAAPALGNDHMRAADGVDLPLSSWLPDGEVRAVIVAVHGFNDYRRAFEKAGEFWAGEGIATYAYDQRGFGAAPHPGRWAGAETMAADLRAMTGLVRDRHPGAPVYWLGSSMGGAVALVAAQQPVAIDGLILAAPAVWAPSPPLRVALWVAAHIAPWGSVTGEGFDIMPSDNIEMLRELSRDPLVRKDTRLDTLLGLVRLMERASRAVDRVDRPLLVLYGAHEEVLDTDSVAAFLDRLDAEADPDRTAVIYPHGYHMLLRDRKADIVWRDVADWVLTGQCCQKRDATADGGG